MECTPLPRPLARIARLQRALDFYRLACTPQFATRFTLTLDEALRTGAIVRGLDLDKTEVRASEALAPSIRTRILQSGDEKLVNILKVLPEESYARLRDILL